MNKKAAILLLKGYEFIVEKEVYDLALGFDVPYSYRIRVYNAEQFIDSLDLDIESLQLEDLPVIALKKLKESDKKLKGIRLV